MPKPPDLELLRQILSQDELHIMCAIVLRTTVADDNSVLFVRFNLVPDNVEMVGIMSWDSTGPNAGIFQRPVSGDLVLVAFVEGNEDQVFVIRRLSSIEDKLPPQMVDGSSVIRALAGKKAHLLSDTAVLLGRGGSDPTEKLVLGNIFRTSLIKILTEISKTMDEQSKELATLKLHTHLGNLGIPTTPPDTSSSTAWDANKTIVDASKIIIDAEQASPITDSKILSDLSKTEK